MSDWQVNLEMVEGGSRKFWRARVDGSTLYVNFGRIGTTGQTQVKELGSPDAAGKEMQSLERSKRKKGYAAAGDAADSGAPDESDDGDDDGDDEAPRKKKARATPAPIAPIAAAPEPPPMPTSVDLSFDRAGRKTSVRIEREGESLRLVAVEKYASDEEAVRALGRLAAAFEAEGYSR